MPSWVHDSGGGPKVSGRVLDDLGWGDDDDDDDWMNRRG